MKRTPVFAIHTRRRPCDVASGKKGGIHLRSAPDRGRRESSYCENGSLVVRVGATTQPRLRAWQCRIGSTAPMGSPASIASAVATNPKRQSHPINDILKGRT